MDIRPLTDTFSAAPQIDPAELPDIAAAGYTTVICNRPDMEVTEDLHAEAMAKAAADAGLAFFVIPVGHGGMSMEMLDQTAEILENSAGPVLAYCRSGTRSTHVWAFTMAGKMPVDDIIAAAARGGYDLSPARGQLEQLAAAR
ncbi:TIGR01244 family sulfur transferase [Actibacterium pelagium]|uniref:TIGR01244 family protein n=1 Tax=Actibacterium pelagium TaxID=2029103 RepID=A0A917AEE2_9RHOB|nr:TIGR01244 family sulfur transferase [Actibacterium pelagium]GGE45733.1 TIGR01244 family protein [Actibacterium pelagium]